jgi:hypothetical protein
MGHSIINQVFAEGNGEHFKYQPIKIVHPLMSLSIDNFFLLICIK